MNQMNEQIGAQAKPSASLSGILVLNLGTPDNAEPPAVGRYLTQFLMDKWVIDIPWLFRWILVNILIVPKRKFLSSAAYQKIWRQDGSPLLKHTRALSERIAASLGSGFHVEVAMRYGNPSIESAFQRLLERGCREVRVLGLYPQYAESSTRTAQEELARVVAKSGYAGQVRFLEPFYADSGFISAYSALIRQSLERERPDHLLFSFHSIPERHVQRLDPSGAHCLRKDNCCAEIGVNNRNCYRAQCFVTARMIAAQLGLPADKWSVSFQSRLGRTPWLQPYTDKVLVELPAKGVRSLAVVCPSFVTDCLETVEEIDMRGREEFLAAGGEKFTFIPCLNDDPSWARSAAQLLRDAGRGPGF